MYYYDFWLVTVIIKTAFANTSCHNNEADICEVTDFSRREAKDTFWLGTIEHIMPSDSVAHCISRITGWYNAAET